MLGLPRGWHQWVPFFPQSLCSLMWNRCLSGLVGQLNQIFGNATFRITKKKKKGIWKDPAGERGVRTMVSTRYYLSFGLFISRKGVCESISGTYEKTSTDGKFLFHKASKLSQRGRPQFSPLLKKCLMSYALFLFAPTTVPPIFLQCYLAPLQILPSFSFSLSFFLFLSLAPTLMTLAPPCTRSSSAGFKWWAENITEFKWWFWCWG